MKTNRKLQLLAAATVAMLAINPAARAQTPAPLSDEELLHALATGQVPTNQLGAGGGDDEKRAASASPGTASIIVGGIGIDFAATESYGGGLYLQGNTAPNYGGAAYYGGGIYNTTADSQPLLAWYNDIFNIVSAQVPAPGFKDADDTAADLRPSTASYGGAFYLSGTALPGGVQFSDNDCDGSRGATSQPANGSITEEFPEWVRSSADQRASNGVYPGLYLQGSPTIAQIGVGGGDDTRRPSGVAGICDDADNCIHNGGAIYNATTGSPSVNSTYGGAIYRSTAASLYGETLPGDQLTDAHLDAMILDALAGVADTSDNCPVAPMPR